VRIFNWLCIPVLLLYWAESHFGLDYKSGQKTVRVEAAKKGFGEYQLDKINGDVDFRWKK
jgi:hypothetical protein